MKKIAVVVFSSCLLPLLATSVIHTDVVKEITDYWNTEGRANTVVDVSTSAGTLRRLNCESCTRAVSAPRNLNSEMLQPLVIMIK